METIVIGAGHRSKTDLNPEQKAFVSMGMHKYEDTQIDHCFFCRIQTKI